jgi:pilus assembly protein FimV
MRLRARWGIAPLLAAPAGAWALGLGQLEVQSVLNQPFRAEIALSATADELQGLKVGLADADAFARQGLDRPAFLSRLEFRIVTGRDGRSVIQITSRESIADPVVTMLVQATWARGRNIKEYTVLLDPPVLLPTPAAPPAIQPAETRPSNTTSGGPINRPAAPPVETRPPSTPAPAPAQEVTPAISQPPPPSVSSASPPPPRQPVSSAGGTYGPVQRGETLWALADRMRPEGISINQMMIAIFRENPRAFGGNINILRAGSTLRLPESVDFDGLAATVATAEVVRQTDEWQNRTAQGGQLRLLPPGDTQTARTPPPAPVPDERPTAAPPPRPVDEPAPAATATSGGVAGGAGDRLVAVNNDDLRDLQNAAAADGGAEDTAPAPGAADPGVDVESEQLFADEQTPPEPEQTEAPVATPPPAPAATPVSTEPSLVSRALGYLASPLLWIGIGVAALLVISLWFVRRRRQESEDVTGRWEALESETDDDQETRDATERLRRQAPEETIVVEEQHAERLRPVPVEPEPAPAARRAAAPRPQKSVSPDETLSSQTVINLDQADAVAEADFHIAYGLYDQAAELVQKALEAAPDRRDLKLKLLEVYFMWGNKEAFLKAAEGLRADIGDSDDADWNKVVIMGKQICPDERLFTEAKAGGGGRVDVDLEAGDSPLDLAFDDAASADVAAASGGLDLDLEASDQRAAPKAAKAKSAGKVSTRGNAADDSLDIGARTAAGLEAALFADDEPATQTTPDLSDSLAVTQESPTIERPGAGRWSTADGGDLSTHDSPTVETPTIESLGPKSSSTIKSKTVAMPRRTDSTVEQPGLAAATGEFTAEIDLDDLGLDVKDIEGLPGDLGDLPMAGGQSDTREQPALRDDDGLLSATGVTKVLHGADADEDSTESNTSVLEDQDATMLSGTLTGTEVLEGRRNGGDTSGNTSLVKQLGGVKDDAVDLDLADLTAALHGADTVEQPRSFSRDVFGTGSTPLDLDVGNGLAAEDDDPTGTAEQALDPQTMTEVGTKLDLARAYIDMGDPEGARSILQEVLDEGDSNQRREAQGLIDALHA